MLKLSFGCGLKHSRRVTCWIKGKTGEVLYLASPVSAHT